MQGGSVFAAAVEAMEGTVGRRLVWATGQYLTHIGYPAVGSVDVAVLVDGHRTTQARAVIRHDGTEVLFAVGALGERPFAHRGTWVAPPAVALPSACPLRDVPGVTDGIAVCEVRAALGRSYSEVDGTRGPGRSASWVRLPGGGSRVPTAGDLAIVGDFSMLDVSAAPSASVTGNSLDNTLRTGGREATGWVLLDVTVHAVTDGFCSVTTDLWSEGLAHLGTASQTLVLRELKPGGELPDRTRRITGG